MPRNKKKWKMNHLGNWKNDSFKGKAQNIAVLNLYQLHLLEVIQTLTLKLYFRIGLLKFIEWIFYSKYLYICWLGHITSQRGYHAI